MEVKVNKITGTFVQGMHKSSAMTCRYFKLDENIIPLKNLKYIRLGCPLNLSFLPVLEITGAEPVTGKVSLMQRGYFFFSDLEKVFTVVLRHQLLS